MNKRQAKLAAYARCANTIDNALAGGWDTLETLYGDDRSKVVAAIEEVRDELDRRAGGGR